MNCFYSFLLLQHEFAFQKFHSHFEDFFLFILCQLARIIAVSSLPLLLRSTTQKS